MDLPRAYVDEIANLRTLAWIAVVSQEPYTGVSLNLFSQHVMVLLLRRCLDFSALHMKAIRVSEFEGPPKRQLCDHQNQQLVEWYEAG